MWWLICSEMFTFMCADQLKHFSLSLSGMAGSSKWPTAKLEQVGVSSSNNALILCFSLSQYLHEGFRPPVVSTGSLTDSLPLGLVSIRFARQQRLIGAVTFSLSIRPRSDLSVEELDSAGRLCGITD